MNQLKLTSANIVVLANTFNASIATKEWLFKHIIDEEPEDYISTPVLSAYKTSQVDMLLDQSRLQITCKRMGDEDMAKCAETARSYVSQLPHTPYTAIGFNYVLKWNPSPGNVGKLTTEVFAHGLRNPEAMFSEYAVAPTILAKRGEARVQLAVKPSLDISAPLEVRVNFHYETSDVEVIVRHAAEFHQASKEAILLVQSIMPEG